MNLEIEQRSTYSFGAFRLEPSERRLWRGDEPMTLKPKQFDLLSFFVANAGRTVKKNELLEAVWPNAYVDESTLARNVSWLRALLDDGATGSKFIETVPKLGYRFTGDGSLSASGPQAESDTLVVEEHKVQYFRKEETITYDEAPVSEANLNPFRTTMTSLSLALIAITLVVLAGAGFAFFPRLINLDERGTASAGNPVVAAANSQFADAKTNYPPNGLAAVDRRDSTVTTASANSPITIGTVIQLRSQLSEDAGYLDAWGSVKGKPGFTDVATELMFVATHANPDRQVGSGSWEIISAMGKKEGEPLEYGDRIHLRNLYPDAGYLDNCGWIKDLPVFSDFKKLEKFAVFTAYSEERDAGTGTWIVGSDTKFEGDPVLLDDHIFLENGFAGGGYLNVTGRVADLPAFNDYDGSHLVFIHQSSAGRHPQSGIWAISVARPAAN